jgi:hypothetical protein
MWYPAYLFQLLRIARGKVDLGGWGARHDDGFQQHRSMGSLETLKFKCGVSPFDYTRNDSNFYCYTTIKCKLSYRFTVGPLLYSLHHFCPSSHARRPQLLALLLSQLLLRPPEIRFPHKIHCRTHRDGQTSDRQNSLRIQGFPWRIKLNKMPTHLREPSSGPSPAQP